MLSIRSHPWTSLAGLFVALAWLAVLPGREAQAQEIAQAGPQPGPQSEIDTLKKQVQELQERIGQLKPPAASRRVAPTGESGAAVSGVPGIPFEPPVGPVHYTPTIPDWFQKVRIYGDIGIRAEIMHNVAHLTGEDMYRTRYRLRVFGYYQPNPYWEGGFRIANADPRYPGTGWETFGQTQSPGEVSGPEAGSGRSGFVTFDRMFINWTPNRWVKIQTGKQELPFWKPWMVWGSSVWHDDDVQPAGFAEKFNLPTVGALKSMRLTFGQFHLGQAQSSRTDARGFNINPTSGSTLWGSQISGLVAARPDLDVAFGLGFFAFDNLNTFARGSPVAVTTGYRNIGTNQLLSSTPATSGTFACTSHASVVGSVRANEPGASPNPRTIGLCDRFLSQYKLLNAGIEFYWKTRIPVRFAIDTVYNLGAERRRPDADKLAFAGLTHISVGSFREPGEMQFGAGYYWGQADATWINYADDDYLNTNVNTIMFNWKWKIFRDVTLVWDNYIRRWNDSQLAVEQAIVPNATSGNATFTSSRLTAVLNF